MSRVCIINVAGLSMRLLDRLGGLWSQSLARRPSAIAATFPVVSASVQASMTTGVEPGAHGVVAGGIFRRQCKAMSLDERSNTLLDKKRFWHARSLPRRPKVSLLFWSNPLAGAADYVIGASTYGPMSQLVADVPRGFYGNVAAQVGQFDPHMVRGPGASWHAAEWIAAAAKHIWRAVKPDLQWVYMPGINFEIIRHGCESRQAAEAIKAVDSLAAGLAGEVIADGGNVVLVSDGGYVDVNRFACPNDALRRAGLLKVRQDGNAVDLENSRAVAMVDHQIAHVYCQDQKVAQDAAAVIEQEEGVDKVLCRDELFGQGLGHDRAGECIVLAKPDSWLCYRWWDASMPQPAVAVSSDTAAKTGYDPCELMPGEGGAIEARPELCRASRGLCSADLADQCLIAASAPIEPARSVIDVPDVVKTLLLS